MAKNHIRTPPEKQDRPRSLAGAYLEQAYESLQSAGDPAVLYADFIEFPAQTDAAKGFRLLVGRKVHHTQCRNAILFSALAAEAYVNEALLAKLARKDFEAVDRMSTYNKYVVATKVAFGTQAFSRSKEPMPAIKELFALRHKLVHPKPGFAPSSYLEPAGKLEATFTPNKASWFLVMVAASAEILVRRAFGEEFDFPASVIWHGRDAVFQFADTLARMPALDAPRPKLFRLMTDAVQRA